ncbi:hypothetical protein DsansV1_C07g0075231 [Dioscorea sansibarensis]
MEADRNPNTPSRSSSSSSSKKREFSVYQNPSFSAALTASSLRPSSSALLFFSSSALVSALSFLALSSMEDSLIHSLGLIRVSKAGALFLSKSLRTALFLVFITTLSAFLRALALRNGDVLTRQRMKDQQKKLSKRQLNLLGIKPKPCEKTDDEVVKKHPKSITLSSEPPLVPIRKSGFGYTPTRSSLVGSEQQQLASGAKKMSGMSPVSTPARLHSQYISSPSTPWSKGGTKGMQSEALFEQFLANVDEKFCESAVKRVTTTPPATIRGFGIASPSSIASSATVSGTTRSTPLRPVRMSNQKYSTPPKKGEGELPPPMSVEQQIEAFEFFGVYPQIEQWQDRLRQWFSSMLMNPLLEKIETSHIQLMQAAARVGFSITVSQVGSDTLTTTVPVNVSPIDGAKEWQPTFTLDEDGVLHQLRANLLQVRDASASQSPVVGLQQPQPNPILPFVQACVDAITEHQRLNTLMKGELIRGLLPIGSVRADYAVQRVRELAEGTCLKNYDYMGSVDSHDKAGKKYSGELPSDSHLLLYLFSAFLDHPKWMLHVDPASYSGAQSSKNPLFLGVLPPKERFPEKYVAIVSGVPSVVHPGACILAVGKQSPPTFALYWDKKLQVSLQGRTALLDAILLLCHRIKVGYGAVVRGVHLGSSALNILSVLDSENES